MADQNPDRSRDADIARLRAYMIYADLSIRSVAQAAGVSRRAVEYVNFPDRFKPQRGTLSKLVAIIPADFTEDGAAAEYLEARSRVRDWFAESGLKRYQLEPLGIQYEWVQHIAAEDWSPSWFALRKLLALISRETPSEKGQSDGTRTPPKAEA